jgi:hypothetical protein
MCIPPGKILGTPLLSELAVLLHPGTALEAAVPYIDSIVRNMTHLVMLLVTCTSRSFLICMISPWRSLSIACTLCMFPHGSGSKSENCLIGDSGCCSQKPGKMSPLAVLSTGHGHGRHLLTTVHRGPALLTYTPLALSNGFAFHGLPPGHGDTLALHLGAPLVFAASVDSLGTAHQQARYPSRDYISLRLSPSTRLPPACLGIHF